MTSDELLTMFDAWLLAEVSYLPTVLRRMEAFAARVPTTMVGYDTLPMSEPANYRFRPGTAPWVSEYFRLLATAASVVCISDEARDSILGRLRRDPGPPDVASRTRAAITSRSALPSRQNAPFSPVWAPWRPASARSRSPRPSARPRDSYGLDAELLFIGGHTASQEGINRAIRTQMAARRGARGWRGRPTTRSATSSTAPAPSCRSGSRATGSRCSRRSDWAPRSCSTGSSRRPS